MALQKDYDSENFGVHVDDTYIRLAYFVWSTADMKGQATFSVWATPTAEAEGKVCLGNITIEFTELDNDWRAMIYEHAKTLPEFAGALDV